MRKEGRGIDCTGGVSEVSVPADVEIVSAQSIDWSLRVVAFYPPTLQTAGTA